METKHKTLPVLVCSYNRPSNLESLLTKLQQYNIVNIYFFSDGPKDTEESKRNVSKCREIFDEYFPLNSRERILYLEKNLGCRKGMIKAISWYFTKVEFGIILEDDCIPSEDFFTFVESMKEPCERRKNVFCISGTRNEGSPGNSIVLSSFPFIWGWATWADKWRMYRENFDDSLELSFKNSSIALPPNRQSNGLKPSWKRFVFLVHWTLLLGQSGKGNIDTWDYSLIATLWRTKTKCLIPSYNYVVNTGFNDNATHTRSEPPNWVPKSFGASGQFQIEPIMESHELDFWANKFLYDATILKALKIYFRFEINPRISRFLGK
jgi:hypothetical protein